MKTLLPFAILASAIVMMLSGCAAPDPYPLHTASILGRSTEVRSLIEKGASVDSVNKEAQTPLHWSAYKNNVELTKFLIEKGANVNAKEKNGRTPLHWTTYTGATETAKLLIEKGADVNSADKFGQTPLFTAKSNWSANTAEIAKILIRKGGKAPRDATGKTAEERKAEAKQAYDNTVQETRQAQQAQATQAQQEQAPHRPAKKSKGQQGQETQAQQDSGGNASGSMGRELIGNLLKWGSKEVVNNGLDTSDRAMRTLGGSVGAELTKNAVLDSVVTR